MTLASSSTTVKRQPPLLPSQLPTTQAAWKQLLTAMQEQYQSLQSAQSAPNVLPAQYSVAQVSGVPPYTNSNCSVADDATHALYAANSFLVTVTAPGAVAAFSGFPIAIQANQLWYCAFQVWGANFTGSLSISTSAGTIVSSGIASTTNDGWQLVWTLLDLTAYPDTQATWKITFSEPGQYWIDGLQMSPAGKPFLAQPPFVVGTGSVTAGSISGSSLAPGSVTGGVGGAIAPVTVTAVNIAPQTITALQIAPVAITAAQIAPLTITAAEIANNTITSGQIYENTITAGQIAANTITSGQIAANTITSGQIAAYTILALNIDANTITSGQIAANTILGNDIAAETITGDNIAANTITALNVAANAIETNNITSLAVTADKIATNTITALQIAANTITSGQLNVTSLSALSANLGTITEGTVIFDNGSHMRVMGIGFGASSNLLDWYGPHLSSISLCSEANALFYQDISGNSYHGGNVNIQFGSNSYGTYIKFPATADGRVYIWQFGSTTSTGSDPNTVMYPIAFPTTVLSVTANPIHYGGGGIPATTLNGLAGNSNFSCYTGGFGITWMAIGY
jgi:hypothetical protein